MDDLILDPRRLTTDRSGILKGSVSKLECVQARCACVSRRVNGTLHTDERYYLAIDNYLFTHLLPMNVI